MTKPMTPESNPGDYGPNYPDAKAEARATRKARRLSWFDAWAFALLLICILTPVLFLVSAIGAHDSCRTTATICSVQQP